jgi:hypothetical protein
MVKKPINQIIGAGQSLALNTHVYNILNAILNTKNITLYIIGLVEMPSNLVQGGKQPDE